MKAIVVDLTMQMPQDRPLHFSLSFARFIDYLRQRINQESGLSKKILVLALDRLSKSPAFEKPMSLNSVKDFEEQLQLVYNLLVPALQQKQTLVWGLSSPLLPVIFYGSDLLYHILLDDQTRQAGITISETDHQVQIESIYRFILERLYGLPALEQNDMLVTFNLKGTSLTKYYQIHIDSRFAGVTARGELPSIDSQEIDYLSGSGLNIERLSAILPIDAFHFDGFSVITASDVTQKHTLEVLKSIILSRNALEKANYFDQIHQTLKAMVGDPDLEFGLMPFLKVNDKLVFNDDILESSRLISAASKIQAAETTYLNLAQKYLTDPQLIVIQDIAASAIKNELKTILCEQEMHAFAILPVYYDAVLCGGLEMYSRTVNGIDRQRLKRLEPALEILGRACEHILNGFETAIETVIREKFTSLQPAVTWKFRDAAWNYLREKAGDFSETDNSVIEFKDVYPLYGAIDIRGSTIQRNKAVHQDLRAHLALVIGTLSFLQNGLNMPKVDFLLTASKEVMAKLDDQFSDNYELEIKYFLDNQLHPFFSELDAALKHNNMLVGIEATTSTTIDLFAASLQRYHDFIDPQTGEAYTQRRALEISIRMINDVINQELNAFSIEMQKSYPIYFEKFRTDGVEYDIYIGQSLNPELPFKATQLSHIRFGQLKSMADIACRTNALLASMPAKLQTTHLIFVNPGSIDITFRSDERRFDVEGTYNIRYQVIKKRIDKVHIFSTSQRLTQPGKIAIVYFDGHSAAEYVAYIMSLQKQRILLNDLEFLELEHLQGVNGLKALRVGVNYR